MLTKFVRRCVGAGLLAGLLAHPAAAQVPSADPAAHADNRIAFIAGNAGYAQGPVVNALNDAGLVAEALRSIGFEIVEAADLNQSDFIRSYREFLDRVTEAGPDTVAFVYFSGLGFEFEGDNYLALADARIQRTSDIALGTVRLSDLIRPLAATPARAKIVAVDASRPLPFSIAGRPLAKGLAAVDPAATMLIAYSAAPGTVAEDRPGDYGPYATAIAEMIRAPGLDLNAVFTQIRVRTHQLTEGNQTPFHVTALQDATPLVPADAPSDTGSAPPVPRIVSDDKTPLEQLGPNEAYARTIERDTLQGYEEFAKTYPASPYTQRIRVTTRARREALLWTRALELNTPEAYWTYLRRYPNGMYAADAEYRLRRLQAEALPPPDFIPVEIPEVPLPPPEEPIGIADVWPVAPPPPEDLIAPLAPIFVALPAPAVPIGVGVLRGPGRIPGLRQPRRPPDTRRPPRPPGADGRRPPRPPGADGRRPPRPPGIGRLPRPPGPDARRPPRPPGADTRRPPRQPGADARRPPRPPGADARRPPRQPGADARRPPRRPGADARRPPRGPGADARRPPRRPGADARRAPRRPGADARRPPRPGRDARRPQRQQAARPQARQQQQRMQRQQQRMQRQAARPQQQRMQRQQARQQPQRMQQQRFQPQRVQQRQQRFQQPRFQQQRMQQRAAPQMRQQMRPQVQRPMAQPRRPACRGRGC
jgi:hypothetical protein